MNKLSLLLLATLASPSLTYASTLGATPPSSIANSANVVSKFSSYEYCSPSGAISDACCNFETVDDVNNRLADDLEELAKTKFFRYYKINLHKGCPFWHENPLCVQESCSVQEADESEIPEEWKTSTISAVDFSQTESGGFSLFKKSCEYTHKDFCIVEDETSTDGVYVDLLKNPERFTGYAGPSAGRIWEAIYRENCFTWLGSPDDQGRSISMQSLPMMQDALQNICMEKRVFYKLISGLHSSISTHICNNMLNRTSGVWYADPDCYYHRVGKFPDRVENIYFTYVVLLRAITKLSPFLKNYNFCTGNDADTRKVTALVENVLTATVSCPSTFDEKLMFATSASQHLKEEFKNHFRNVSRIMDCVACEKCRLWGKMQVSGLGTALKVLFSYGDNADYLLTRSELVALVNGFARISESLKAKQEFEKIFQERRQKEKQQLEEAEKVKRAGGGAAESPDAESTPKTMSIEFFLQNTSILDPRYYLVWLSGIVFMLVGTLKVTAKGWERELAEAKKRNRRQFKKKVKEVTGDRVNAITSSDDDDESESEEEGEDAQKPAEGPVRRRRPLNQRQKKSS
ncbi:hypothetical protein HK102_000162 [Quaeritorhiza haematococci]|nr:hypothetical protein HK102_000162 [Quaeritorhiza haematococci]